MQTSKQETVRIADIGDYLKVFAFSAVVLQPILSLILKTHPSHHIQLIAGILYNLVKYTAPAFIFGILYTSIRTNPNANLSDYSSHMRKQWHALFVPTIWWTLIYLLIMPWVQQREKFHNFASFLWQFINGNAAPHMWYNTMMLQFIIIMPFFWALAHYVNNNPKRGITIAIITLIGYFLWLVFYDVNVFHGPHANNWYLLDRIFISFIIYGIFGVLAWKFNQPVNKWLRKHWKLLILFVVIMFIWTNVELHSFGYPVSLSNAPYYKPSMTLYSLGIIGLIAALCIWHTEVKKDKVLTIFHFLATYAYRAFLSYIFWLQILWRLTNFSNFNINHPILTIIICWILTWLISFFSAIIIHKIWHQIKISLNLVKKG